MLKILLLVQKEQRVILDRLYDAIAANSECDIRWLAKEQQANLQRYFREEVDTTRYDRIVLFLRFKQEIRQAGFISRLPNLVILEHDAYQNYIPCKYKGVFSRHYRRLPGARILSSGAGVARRLRAEGFDAVFVPKGYDQAMLRDLQQPRDIELAFLGSIKSDAYSRRKALLEELAKVEDVLIARTGSGEEYLETLNRIRFFVSADVGMGEYMIKNFEAMACGCVLFAYNQGEEENRALGFVDMENLVLYSNVDELRQKLALLRADPNRAEQIALNGRSLAVSRYSFASLGAAIVEAAMPPLRPAAPARWFDRLRNTWGW